jgi:3D-(3,5/4)-trihydroxycyclohexane-1,2-dione acylhydrolase (decyclizing)
MIRLTVAQAAIRFLANQYSERDGVEQRLIPGCFGIFGHGNVAGIGQACYRPRPKQRATCRTTWPVTSRRWCRGGLRPDAQPAPDLACTTDRPGATNMLTGAALATVNRIPVLLLPSDTFATRVAAPVLQELEDPRFGDVSVNDAFRPLSRFFDRVDRPEQLPSALLGAMRVLTDNVETGAATICLPQDVQAEAHDWPEDLFRRRVWHVARPAADPASIRRAANVIASARRPLIVAGGGVISAAAEAALREFAAETGIPVADTQAGKGAVLFDHPCAVGGVGSTGTPTANAIATDADVVIGIGTRYSDFTTASHTAFGNPDVRFVNLNVASFDAAKHSAVSVVADARSGIEALRTALEGNRVGPEYRERYRHQARAWADVEDESFHLEHQPLPAQTEIIGALDDVMQPRDVIVKRPAACPATCSGCGGRDPSSTTSSTATRAWATRSPASLASRWPRRTGRSSASSATAPTS